ncbi:hypothetical protein RYA05_02715 [Pseudomonas syringae pv. actinidiae]|nr:hypothetical protein [Pseudomonas syringae pv. actinidiae]
MDLTPTMKDAQDHADERVAHKVGSWTVTAFLLAYLPVDLPSIDSAIQMGLVMFIAFYLLPAMIAKSFITKNYNGMPLHIGTMVFFALLIFAPPVQPGSLSRLLTVAVYALSSYAIAKAISLIIRKLGN